MRPRISAQAAYEKGSYVWFNHPEETWIPAVVTEGGSGDVTVELEDRYLNCLETLIPDSLCKKVQNRQPV